jgi:hypothetical protein
MLGSLDQDLLGHVLLRLQLVDILAVFAAACTARDMRSGVWVWLNRQRKLTVEELHGSRHAIFRMTQVVRNKLSGSLCRFYVGKSFFCFEGERDRRDHLMQLFPRESLAQRILPFFQLTAERHYMEDGCHSGALLYGFLLARPTWATLALPLWSLVCEMRTAPVTQILCEKSGFPIVA